MGIIVDSYKNGNQISATKAQEIIKHYRKLSKYKLQHKSIELVLSLLPYVNNNKHMMNSLQLQEADSYKIHFLHFTLKHSNHRQLWYALAIKEKNSPSNLCLCKE